MVAYKSDELPGKFEPPGRKSPLTELSGRGSLILDSSAKKFFSKSTNRQSVERIYRKMSNVKIQIQNEIQMPNVKTSWIPDRGRE